MFAECDEWDDALEEAHNLARAILAIHNQQEGIEHMGGPFRWEDYEVTTRRFDNSRIKRLGVFYEYKRPLGLKGRPDAFEIGVDWDIEWPFNFDEKVVAEKGEYSVLGEFKPGEIETILNILPDYKDGLSVGDQSDPNIPKCIINIDSKGKITRARPKNMYIHSHVQSIKQISEDRVQIMYSRGYISMENYLGHFAGMGDPYDLLIKRAENGVFQADLPKFVKLSEKYINPFQQKFLLIGNIDDETLLKVINISRRIPRRHPISVIECFDNRYAFLMGNQAHNFPFGNRLIMQPTASVTVKKNQDEFKCIRYLDTFQFLMSVFEQGNDMMPLSFPLLQKPTPQETEMFVCNTPVEGYVDKISKEDIKKIREILLRLRRIRYPTEIIVQDKNHVRAFTGWALGERIEFHKINNIWRVTEIREGIR